jgi:hypothetical protein
MNTQNVNTAALEPSERWGEEQAKTCIEKCLVLSTAHMTAKDNDLFYWLSRRTEKGDGAWMWIHDTGYGFLISLDADGDRLRWLHHWGISESLCYLLETVSGLSGTRMFHFDRDANIQPGFVTYDW